MWVIYSSASVKHYVHHTPYNLSFKRNDIEFVDSCKVIGVKVSLPIAKYIQLCITYSKSNKVLLDFALLTSTDGSSQWVYCSQL